MSVCGVFWLVIGWFLVHLVSVGFCFFLLCFFGGVLVFRGGLFLVCLKCSVLLLM